MYIWFYEVVGDYSSAWQIYDLSITKTALCIVLDGIIWKIKCKCVSTSLCIFYPVLQQLYSSTATFRKCILPLKHLIIRIPWENSKTETRVTKLSNRKHLQYHNVTHFNQPPVAGEWYQILRLHWHHHPRPLTDGAAVNKVKLCDVTWWESIESSSHRDVCSLVIALLNEGSFAFFHSAPVDCHRRYNMSGI